MMGSAGKWLAVMALLFGLVRAGPAAASRGHESGGQASGGQESAGNHSVSAMQDASFSLISPTVCPAEGCAPGQRLNLLFQYELLSFDPYIDPPSANVMVCFYAPVGWVDLTQSPPQTSPVGGVTNVPFTPASACPEEADPPEGYELIAAREQILNQEDAYDDSLGIALRLAPTAASAGSLYAALYEKDAFGWTISPTQEDYSPSIPVDPLPAGSTMGVYVANTATECDGGAFSPCFINSGDDLADGLGTGLKDAIDVVPDGSTISVTGNYAIKTNTVVVDSPVTLFGIATARITYAGATCTFPMLSLRSAIILRNLEVNDGTACPAGQNRSLVEVNSSRPVLIETSTLTGGDQAVQILDNSGPVTVRYNQISDNAGYGVYWENGQSEAALDVVANNLIGNGNTINCGSGLTVPPANRKANHNYWGSLTPPTADTTRCMITPGKQLGAPVALREGAAGVQVERVTVTRDKQYSFASQIAYQYTGDDARFDLYIVNHGYGDEDWVPFTLANGTHPSPCSNFWDVFLADGASPTGTLRLFVRYDKTASCLIAIESTQLCDQTANRTVYPLWWYDPASGITDLWDTTGQKPAGPNAGGVNGQETTCDIDNSEIQVAIDNDGRPNLQNDLNYIPIMAGVEVLQSFRVLGGSSVITVEWVTRHEPDITGFFVLRSTDNVNFTPITSLIPRRGSALGGVTYQFLDPGRVANTTYYYRLRVMRIDGFSIYSTIQSTTAAAATPTATPLISPTSFPTRTPGPSPTFTIPPPTRTNTPTLVPAQFPTRIPSGTVSPGPATATLPVLTFQPVPSGQPGFGETPATADPNNLYPAPATPRPTLPLLRVTATGATSAATASATPPAPVQPDDTDTGAMSVARSLLLGFAGGAASLGLMAVWFFFLRRRDVP